MSSMEEMRREVQEREGRDQLSTRQPLSQEAKEAAIARRLKEFEMALDEAVACDTLFLQMMREDRTRLSRDTKDWIDEYSLDKRKIASMAQRLMRGDYRHLCTDLSPQDSATVEETIARMRCMSFEEIMDSIASDD